MKQQIRMTSFLAVLTVVSAGCGTEERSHDEEACAHLTGTTSTEVSATNSPSSAPSVAADHRRYDIALPTGAAGYVQFASSEATDYAFVIDADVPFVIEDTNGTVIDPEETASSSEACEELKGKFVVPLGIGTYRIKLGPGSGVVGLVIEEAAHDHEH